MPIEQDPALLAAVEGAASPAHMAAYPGGGSGASPGVVAAPAPAADSVYPPQSLASCRRFFLRRHRHHTRVLRDVRSGAAVSSLGAAVHEERAVLMRRRHDACRMAEIANRTLKERIELLVARGSTMSHLLGRETQAGPGGPSITEISDARQAWTRACSGA